MELRKNPGLALQLLFQAGERPIRIIECDPDGHRIECVLKFRHGQGQSFFGFIVVSNSGFHEGRGSIYIEGEHAFHHRLNLFRACFHRPPHGNLLEDISLLDSQSHHRSHGCEGKTTRHTDDRARGKSSTQTNGNQASTDGGNDRAFRNLQCFMVSGKFRIRCHSQSINGEVRHQADTESKAKSWQRLQAELRGKFQANDCRSNRRSTCDTHYRPRHALLRRHDTLIDGQAHGCGQGKARQESTDIRHAKGGRKMLHDQPADRRSCRRHAEYLPSQPFFRGQCCRHEGQGEGRANPQTEQCARNGSRSQQTRKRTLQHAKNQELDIVLGNTVVVNVLDSKSHRNTRADSHHCRSCVPPCRRIETMCDDTANDGRAKPCCNGIGNQVAELTSFEVLVIEGIYQHDRNSCRSQGGQNRHDLFHMRQGRTEVRHELFRQLPHKELCADCGSDREDFFEMVFNPVDSRLELLHPLIHGRPDKAIEEVIDGQVPIPIGSSTAPATSTATTATRIVIGFDDVQFVKAHEVGFKLLGCATRFFRAIANIANATRNIVNTTRNARIVHRGKGETKQACDSCRNNTDCLCHRDTHGKHGIENRDKHITERTGSLCDLRFENTKLVRGSVQGSSHIAMRCRDLRHNGVVAQLRFLRLGHVVEGLFDTQVEGNGFQSRLTKVKAEPTQRFKLTRNARL